MFGLGPWEIGVILVIALLVLGPKKLPEMASKLGSGIREFRKASEGFKSTMDAEMYKPDPPATTTTPPEPAPSKSLDDGAAEVIASTVPVENTVEAAPKKDEAPAETAEEPAKEDAAEAKQAEPSP